MRKSQKDEDMNEIHNKNEGNIKSPDQENVFFFFLLFIHLLVRLFEENFLLLAILGLFTSTR